MSSPYSAHRSGRFGSDGHIALDAPEEEEQPLYLSDLRAPQDDDLPDDPFVSESRAGDVVTDAAPPEHAETASALDIPEAAPAPAPTKQRRSSRPPRSPRLSTARRLAVLGGADADVLEDVPHETPRFVQMFFVLASTALVSAVSMGFALVSGVRVAVWVAVPLAIMWALIIFNLDRFLTSTMRSTDRIWKLIGLAIPRVIMAALIGIVVAEPLVLQVFQNDIAREVTTTNLTQAVSDQEAVSGGPEQKALDAASARVSALENQAATGIVAGTSTTSAAATSAQETVDQLGAQLAAAQTTIDQARALYQCELTGQGAGTVPGCTGVTGDGASSAAAQSQLASAQSAYDALAAELEDAQGTLAEANASGDAAVSASEAQNRKQAEDELPAARETYQAALAAYEARASSVANGNVEAVGLLSQMSALESLSQRVPTLGWAHWLIAALFFMIELLPVLVKVLTSYGEPSLYEKADALRRQVALDRVTARTWNERADIARGTA